MITKVDLKNLESQYQIALAQLDNIEYKDAYPYYPKEISDFMKMLESAPWFIVYRPEEINTILQRIEQASINEIREVLTAISRAERFCDGSWRGSLETGVLDPVFRRLRELINM